ncbi:MAG: FAD-dependent oxidoreductase [Polyangiaceae bacterium]|nr:FAD-dependent oxidoreductase [Polyangiaceae bacterium]
MSRGRSTPVAILGAGLTGMSAAIELQRAGVPFRIFEKLTQVGGHAITVEEAGYRFDRTGHLLHLRDPSVREKVHTWLQGNYLSITRKSRVFSQGVYTHYPFQANTYGLPPETISACLLDFIAAATHPQKPVPQNFEEFCRIHFGNAMSERFMLPYNTRLWGVHPSEITSEWCQRFVPLPSLKDVVNGALGPPLREVGYNTHFIYPRLGIGELSHAMQRELPPIELNSAPSSIDLARRELILNGERLPFEVLISTLPLPVLVDLIADVPKEVRQARQKLRSTHLYYLDVALRVPCGQDLHWVYVPEAHYPFYRVGCYSNFSAEMAPPGCSNLYVELASRDAPSLEQTLPEVVAGLLELGFIANPEAVAFARIRRIDYAYVIYDHAYREALTTITHFLAQERLLSAGRYGGWNYSSMEDALIFGQGAAESARSWLA